MVLNYKIFSELLQSKQLKVSDVCKATGISSSSMADWKRGKSHPKSANAMKISNYLGVSVAYLMGIEETESPIIAELSTLAKGLKAEQQIAIINLIKTMLD